MIIIMIIHKLLRTLLLFHFYSGWRHVHFVNTDS